MGNDSVLEYLPGIWKAQKSIPGTTKKEIKNWKRQIRNYIFAIRKKYRPLA